MPRRPHFEALYGHAPGRRAHAERAADVADLPVAPRHHAGQHRAHGEEAALQVQLDDLIELLGRRLPPALLHRPGAAGDVDQDVDPTEGVEPGLHRGLDLRRIRHVAARDHGAPAERADLGRDRLDRRGIAADEHEVGTARASARVTSAPMPLAGPVTSAILSVPWLL